MSLLKNLIEATVSEIFTPKESSDFVDKNNKPIVMDKLVKSGEQRGQIKGVTINKKVKVLWFFPADIEGKNTAEDPKTLEIYP